MGSRRSLILFLMVMCVSLGCESEPRGEYVDLSLRDQLPEREEPSVESLRLAVANVLSPQGTLDNYDRFCDYLAEKLHRPVELLQRRSYQETNQLLARGDVHMAVVCTRAFVVGQEAHGFQLIAVPEIRGKITYHSSLIVRSENQAQSMADLRGSVFAFTDPLSNTGELYPTFLVMKLGELPSTFFSRTFHTYSHDNAIDAVARGLADGAAVDNLVLYHYLQRNPDARIRIIHRSSPFAMPPVIVSGKTKAPLRRSLEEILLHMHEDAAGRVVLEDLAVDRFVTIENEAYDSVREVMSYVATWTEATK